MNVKANKPTLIAAITALISSIVMLLESQNVTDIIGYFKESKVIKQPIKNDEDDHDRVEKAVIDSLIRQKKKELLHFIREEQRKQINQKCKDLIDFLKAEQFVVYKLEKPTDDKNFVLNFEQFIYYTDYTIDGRIEPKKDLPINLDFVQPIVDKLGVDGVCSLYRDSSKQQPLIKFRNATSSYNYLITKSNGDNWGVLVLNFDDKVIITHNNQAVQMTLNEIVQILEHEQP